MTSATYLIYMGMIISGRTKHVQPGH